MYQLELLNINKKALYILKNENILCVEQLLKKTDKQLLKLPNLGNTTLKNIIKALKEIGYDLKIEIKEKISDRPKIRLQKPMSEWMLDYSYNHFKYKIDYETFKSIIAITEKYHRIK